MSEWKPGWVTSTRQQPVKLEKGQRWVFVKPTADGTLRPTEEWLDLTVVSTSESGEVVLRPLDPQMADRTFPVRETTFKGKPTTTRDCPFMWVEERQAKGSEGAYKPGDFLVHEAWDVWSHMHPWIDPETF